MYKKYKILVSLFLSLLIFLAFTPPLNPTAGGWTQQFMPDLGGRNITDVFFLDSLTGWSVTNATNQSNDTTYVLKTTNGGDNWVIQYRKIQTGGGFPGYNRVYFQNQNTGYTCGVTGLDKSTDGGISWLSLNAPFNAYLDMSILNNDTLWLVSPDQLTGGVFRTTNGGINWARQYYDTNGQNPDKIYMYNSRIGFMGRNSVGLYKTTNSGVNWFQVLAGESFTDIHFVDSLTGWKCQSFMKKTTDGGLSWIQQTLPSGGIIIGSGMSKFSVINKDTIWGNGGQAFYGSGRFRGILLRTTNGGTNWLFQVPDTSFGIEGYYDVQFINHRIGWGFGARPTNMYINIHTTTGGDTAWLTGIRQVSSEMPKQFKLFQNYPNPFNPVTKISYDIPVVGAIHELPVRLIVYDILGREVIKLVNETQKPGRYVVEFNGINFASGVYFYRIEAGEYVMSKKMVLVK